MVTVVVDGTPCAVKVACTVWTRGKVGDSFKDLPISIKDVYGDSVDKIVQGNTSNIVYLKSTDDTMLETLSKMSGVRHNVYRNGKSVSKDVKEYVNSVEGSVTYNFNEVEEPVITFNDLMFVKPRNSMVLRAGESPIWNRNETILPMSWRLLMNTIVEPGKKYTLQTVPTLSTAKDFDVRANQPDFYAMVYKKIEQSLEARTAIDAYADVYKYTQTDIDQLDEDVYAADIMRIVNERWLPRNEADDSYLNVEADDYSSMLEMIAMSEDNKEQEIENQKAAEIGDKMNKKIYAGGRVSKADLVGTDPDTPRAVHTLDDVFSRLFTMFNSMPGSLGNDLAKGEGGYYTQNGILLASMITSDENAKEINASINNNANAFGQTVDPASEGSSSWDINDNLYIWLSEQSSWSGICNGVFEDNFIKILESDL